MPKGSGIDLRALSSPQRLKVLGYLCKVELADYEGIRLATDMGTADISRTVKFLVENDLAIASKGMEGRYAKTFVAATPAGRKAMRRLAKEIRKFLPDD